MSANVTVPQLGNYQTAQKPRIIPLYTTDSYAAITAAGYLNKVSSELFLSGDFIAANFGANAASSGLFRVDVSASKIATMAPISNPGEVSLIGAAIVGNLPKFNSVTGDIEDSLIPFGNVLQTTTDITDYQQFVPLTDILINSVGTWTRTRVAQGNYSLVHTPADNTSVIGIDISPALRAAALRGFKLASLDVISTIATAALDAHSLTLSQVSYANNVAVAVSSISLTGTLPTTTQTNPYVSNLAVTTPAFLNVAASKYCAELTVDTAATSVYSFYGLNLHFTKSVA